MSRWPWERTWLLVLKGRESGVYTFCHPTNYITQRHHVLIDASSPQRAMLQLFTVLLFLSHFPYVRGAVEGADVDQGA